MLFLYLVVVNYVHLRFLGLPLDLWGVGGGGWFAKSFLRQTEHHLGLGKKFERKKVRIGEISNFFLLKFFPLNIFEFT